MKPEAIPVAQKPRPVPYHLQRPLQQWLEQEVKEDIFEKVPLNPLHGAHLWLCNPSPNLLKPLQMSWNQI